MDPDAVRHLACPHCGGPVQHAGEGGRTLRCPAGHSFDLARAGYVSLLRGDAGPGTGDTADMVAARVTFLDAGHFAPLQAALVDEATRLLDTPSAHPPHQPDRGEPHHRAPGCVVDVGAGTGHHLAAVLDASPGRAGLALDLSRYALRRAARSHPRVGAVRCDAWRRLPVRDGTADLVLNVFAPRGGAELRRILHRDGALLVVTPTARHLAELVDPLGLVRVDAHKAARVDHALGDHFVRESSRQVTFPLRLSRADAVTVVGMGPSARHVSPQLVHERLADRPEPVLVTAEVTLGVYRPRT